MVVNLVRSLPTDTSAQDTQALIAVWETLHPNSCPDEYNFHLHTHCSDGQLAPERLIEMAVTLGLKGLAITDHHSVNGYYRAQAWLCQYRQTHPQTPLPHLWTGIEITADLNGTEVHLLAYGFDPHHRAMIPYLSGNRPQGQNAWAKSVINALHQAKGLVVLAHPERYRRSASELVPLAVEWGIDGVEAYYAYGNPFPWTPSMRETKTVLGLSETYGLWRTCGTDSHGNSILKRI